MMEKGKSAGSPARLGSLAALVLCLMVLWLPGAFGFSTDDSSLARSFSRTVAPTNAGIVITANFTNGTSLSLRGFYFVEQLPSALAATTLSVSINGRGVSNYVFESGLDGDVYAGCTPCRWILEQPKGFTEANPVPPGGWVQIVYSATASVPASFKLAEFEWLGLAQATTNASFGYSETTDLRTVNFTSTTPSAQLSGFSIPGGWKLQVDGPAGWTYVLQASTDFSDWVPLVTNTAPFAFIETNATRFPLRFYRTLSLP